MTTNELESWLTQEKIERAQIGGVDIDGVWRCKQISREKLRGALHKGLGFCDVLFGWDVADALYKVDATGWHTGYPDAIARIDVSSRRPAPWDRGTALFMLDFDRRDGVVHPACSRQLLRRVVAGATAAGFVPRFGAELEFYLLADDRDSLHRNGFHQPRPLTPGMFGYSGLRIAEHADLLREVYESCKQLDIPIEGLHTETGPGAYETSIMVDDAMRTADRVVLFKLALKQLALRRGITVSFMAKPFEELPGCSLHLHQSLSLPGDRGNLFWDGKRNELSPQLRHYVGGLITLLPDLTCLHWPTINSYKRSVAGTWAPVNATWGLDNRTAAVRVIGDGHDSARVEFRQPGADANPYLAMAASLAAGLWGIEQRVEPPPPVRGDAYQMAAPRLPRTLRLALETLRASKHARELLGTEFVEHFCATREWEADQFDRAVTTWERQRYLEII